MPTVQSVSGESCYRCRYSSQKTQFYKSIQPLAFADEDIEIVAISECKIRLILRAQTKHKVISKQRGRTGTHIVMDEFRFEKSTKLYLPGSLVNNKRSTTEETNRRIRLLIEVRLAYKNILNLNCLLHGTKCRITNTHVSLRNIDYDRN